MPHNKQKESFEVPPPNNEEEKRKNPIPTKGIQDEGEGKVLVDKDPTKKRRKQNTHLTKNNNNL